MRPLYARYAVFATRRGLARIALVVSFIVLPAPAAAAPPWPPATGPGFLFVHYGEEHWNDDDSDLTLPQVVSETVRYGPDVVTMSADKAKDGTVDQLEMWRKIMEPYDRAGIPYFAAVGNRDRKSPDGEGTLPADLTNYENVFAVRPYPFGDAPPYRNPHLSPTVRPLNDPRGASSYYTFDYANVRWVVLENACYSFRFCEIAGTNPPLPDAEGNSTQLEYLRRRAQEANDAGRLVFVMMHMATDDPRDLTYGAGGERRTMVAAPDEEDAFERTAAEVGVDAVFVAHMKGQWLYTAQKVPYYIDGGAGGELHTAGPVGTDHGYWHGYRLVRVDGDRISTDAVPIFEADTIRITGPSTLSLGATARFEAVGKQPSRIAEQKVNALELRDPRPVGQRRVPDRTPVESLPNPARIWTSSNRFVLPVVPSGSEDPRRDPRTQTQDGTFRASCPGIARVRITSGFEEASTVVRVRSGRGAIVRRVSLRRHPLRAGRAATVARVRLAQPAEVLVQLRRAARTLRVLRHGCFRGARQAAGRTLAIRWDGRVRWRGSLREAAPGRYRLEVRILSDRRPLVRARSLTLRPAVRR